MPDKWTTEMRNFKILIYKCCVMYLINFNFRILHRVFILLEWSHLTHGGHLKKYQCCHRSRWEKCQTDRQELCDKDILVSAGLMGHSVLIWNPELVVQTLLTDFNHWKNLKNYIIRFFLAGYDKKLTVWHPDQWKKGQDFVLYCTS